MFHSYSYEGEGLPLQWKRNYLIIFQGKSCWFTGDLHTFETLPVTEMTPQEIDHFLGQVYRDYLLSSEEWLGGFCGLTVLDDGMNGHSEQRVQDGLRFLTFLETELREVGDSKIVTELLRLIPPRRSDTLRYQAIYQELTQLFTPNGSEGGG